MKKTIIVNGIGLSGGGQIIVHQFCKAAANTPYNYILFANFKCDCPENIQLIKINITHSFIGRLWFFSIGLKIWLKRNNISPVLFISFNNLGVWLNKKIPQLIYYHQPVTISKFNWNLFRNEERSLWFYKKIYPYVVSALLNKNSKVVVQTEWIKEGFSKIFKIDKEKVYVIKPNFDSFREYDIPKTAFDSIKTYFFYPAGMCSYKNHIEIINAVAEVKNRNIQYFEKIKVIFTLEKDSIIAQQVQKKGVDKAFEFTSNIPFEKVLSYYGFADALLFPSKIESFGLPLLEAMAFGIKIIAIDESYSREVLAGYPGAKFLNCDNPKIWADEMIETIKHKTRYAPHVPNYVTSWTDFIILIDQSIIR